MNYLIRFLSVIGFGILYKEPIFNSSIILDLIYDKNNEQFSGLDKYLAQDQDEVNKLLEMTAAELKIEKK